MVPLAPKGNREGIFEYLTLRNAETATTFIHSFIPYNG
jgi:hypothetical protein